MNVHPLTDGTMIVERRRLFRPRRAILLWRPAAAALPYDTTGGPSVTTGWQPRDVLLRSAVRRGAWLATLALALTGALGPLVAVADHWAPPPTVYVPRTGHTADRLFLRMWLERS